MFILRRTSIVEDGCGHTNDRHNQGRPAGEVHDILSIFSNPNAASNNPAHNLFGCRIGPMARTIAFRNRFGLDSTDAYCCRFRLIGAFWVPVSVPVPFGPGVDYLSKYVIMVNTHPLLNYQQVRINPPLGSPAMRPYSVLDIVLLSHLGLRKFVIGCIFVLYCSTRIFVYLPLF